MPIVVAALALLVDQVSKAVCAAWLPSLPGGSYPLIPGVFHLTYLENRGAAFGMLSDAPWILHVITCVLIAIMLWILITRYKKMPALMRYSLMLVLAGAVGNFIDRLALGYVRDMLDFCLIDFYVFNIADAAITIGGILLAFDIIFGKGRKFLADELAESPDKIQQQ